MVAHGLEDQGDRVAVTELVVLEQELLEELVAPDEAANLRDGSLRHLAPRHVHVAQLSPY